MCSTFVVTDVTPVVSRQLKDRGDMTTQKLERHAKSDNTLTLQTLKISLDSLKTNKSFKTSSVKNGVGGGSDPHCRDQKVYLGGGFSDKSKTVLVTPNSIQPIPGLQSTQEEADNRVILCTIHTAQNDGVERVVIYASNTDIIVLAVCYAATHLNVLQELWVRDAPSNS